MCIVHRAAEDPDIQATSSTLTMKDPLTYTALNIPIRSINCVHLQCFDAFCFLSMMEQTPDWKCPVCNRAITSDELVHDGFFQDIKDQLPSDGSIDTVIVEVDGTWRTEDNKYGNAKKAVEHREKIKNGLTADNLAQLDTSSSRGSSMALAKDGTPLDVKPDLASSAGLATGGLTVPNGASRGHSKSKTPAAVIELDDDDDEPYENDETPPPPPRLSGFSNHTRLTSTSTGGGGANGRSSGGGVIDLTLSDSEDEASSSVVGLGSRAPSIRTPGKSNGVAGTRSGLSNSVFPRSASQTTTTSATIPPSSSTVNGDASGGGGNVVAGVKRRQDSEAAYEELWGMEPGLERDRGGQAQNGRGSGERPSQIPRYS